MVAGDDGQKLERPFFRRGAELVARDLVGAVLVRNIGGLRRAARIIETEAYIGTHDLACHASKGRTKRTQIMFGPPGYVYVYLIYGMYHMLNIVTADVNDAQAVLLRGAVPLEGWKADLSGPGKLARAFHVTQADYGMDITGEDMFVIKKAAQHRLQIISTPRIGVEYAGHWKDAPLRFVDRNGEVSQ